MIPSSLTCFPTVPWYVGEKQCRCGRVWSVTHPKCCFLQVRRSRAVAQTGGQKTAARKGRRSWTGFQLTAKTPFCRPAERRQLSPCRHLLPLEDGNTGGRRALAAVEMDFTPTQLLSVPAVLPTIVAAEIKKTNCCVCIILYTICTHLYIKQHQYKAACSGARAKRAGNN